MEYKSLFESDIENYIEEIAPLRIAIFRDFPYLYEGSLEYEEKYLGRYAKAKGSFISLALSNGKAVGATSCLPLASESAEIREGYQQTSLPEESSFYFGESLLLPEFRGQGIGHKFFDHREAYAHEYLENLSHTTFCAVERSHAHPLRPQDYKNLHGFWEKRKYAPLDSAFIEMSWPDIGESHESKKRLQVWSRDYS